MKVGVYTLGCKVNLYESEYIISLLKNHGFEIVNFQDKADIYIINTCSVTNDADKKSRKMIHQAKKRNSKAIIVVMGCFSQVKPQEVEADIVLGTPDKSQVLTYIEEYLEKREPIYKIYDLNSKKNFDDMQIDHFDNHTRAFVKIEDGCNAFCSYCIIPYTRGRVRSKPYAKVIEEVTSLVKKGYLEIVLTGIHIGKYGLDLENMDFYKLLKGLVQIPNLYRLRISSIEVNELTDDIINLIKDEKVIARHFHVPLQSGSDKILKLMNRRYDTLTFEKTIEKLRKVDEDISLTTDLIVGFPGEDESDFQDTLSTLKRIGFTKIHTFPYSPREKTPASQMSNQVNSLIKKKRVQEVLQLLQECEKNYYNKYLNKTVSGVLEIHHDGKMLVHTSNFIPITVEGEYPNNSIVDVEIIEVDTNLQVKGVVRKVYSNNSKKMSINSKNL